MDITNRSSKQVILFAIVLYSFCVSGHEKQSELIYILQWSYTSWQEWIYRDLEMGQKAFTSRNCTYQNCFITANRSYFKNVLDYDVFMFNAVHYSNYPFEYFGFPHVRSKIQLYILACVEPAAYYGLSDYLNGIFNLTWTYKLDSDIVHPYILVKNYAGDIIGPNLNMRWVDINDMAPTNWSIIRKLENKRYAALWVASNCFVKHRIIYILKLQNILQSKYGLQLHIFGKCGNDTACSFKSSNDNRPGLLSNCYDKIESDYYFYLAFENSNSEDYVSEKVLHGLNHFAVPIVYGGADYKRFFPDGIYLDATNLEVEALANKMYDIINDPPRYYDFFKWHGYYSFHDTADDSYRYTVCELCAFLNREKQKSEKTVRIYDNLIEWWNAPVPDQFSNVDSFRDYTLSDTES